MRRRCVRDAGRGNLQHDLLLPRLPQAVRRADGCVGDGSCRQSRRQRRAEGLRVLRAGLTLVLRRARRRPLLQQRAASAPGHDASANRHARQSRRRRSEGASASGRADRMEGLRPHPAGVQALSGWRLNRTTAGRARSRFSAAPYWRRARNRTSRRWRAPSASSTAPRPSAWLLYCRSASPPEPLSSRLAESRSSMP